LTTFVPNRVPFFADERKVMSSPAGIGRTTPPSAGVQASAAQVGIRWRPRDLPAPACGRRGRPTLEKIDSGCSGPVPACPA
jgi:hypothetical protein